MPEGLFVNLFLTRCHFILRHVVDELAYGTFRRISKRVEFAQQAARSAFLQRHLFDSVIRVFAKSRPTGGDFASMIGKIRDLRCRGACFSLQQKFSVADTVFTN
jgi:hypothetical protein